MKYLIFLLTLLPGAALAHGGHAPVPDAVHSALHVSILVAFGVVLALLIGVVWYNQRR